MSNVFQSNNAVTQLVANSKTLTGNAATVVTPIFRITGTVNILKLYAIVTTVLGATHTVAYFRLNDQTDTPDITLFTGTDGSAAGVGSLFIKSGLAAVALNVKKSSSGRVIEPVTAGLPVASGFYMEAKNGANTDIEYSYTTADAPTSGVLQFFVEYMPISANGAIAAV